jgi:hypothetical protein
VRRKIHYLRRGAAAGITLAFVTLIAAMRPTSEPSRTFQITLGLNDQKPTAWDARVKVSGGEITSLSGWRFEDDDATNGVTGWKCSTHEYHIPQPYQSGPYRTGVDAQQPTEIWPNGVILRVRGAAPTVTVEFKQGNIEFSAVQEIGSTTQHLHGQVEVQRLPEVSILRPAELGGAENSRQDDYPDFCVSRVDDRQYLAWVTYQHRADRVFLSERHGGDGPWSRPLEIDGPGDHFRAAIAEAGDGTVWITWSQQRDGRWSIMGRPYRDGKLGAIESISTENGPNFWHWMTRDRGGRVWIVWQAFHDRQSEIWARCHDQGGWHPAIEVAGNGAHNWDPCIVADTGADRVWVGWDTYEGGNYGVRLRTISPTGSLGPVVVPEPSKRFQAHISLACDSAGRLWAAWDQAGMQWGKDYGLFYPNSGGTRLYEYRHLAMRCLDGGSWHAPAMELVLPERMSHFAELPRLQADEHGRIWLAFRSRTTTNQRSDGWANRGRWDIYATCWLGDRWLPPVELPESSGRNDMRTVSGIDRDGNIYFAYASDNRAWMPPAMLARNLSIAVSRLESSLYSAARLLAPPPPIVEEQEHIVHPRESEDIARVRNYEIRLGGKNYHIYRGDLHRHTDISMDGIGDGSLLDLYRYAHDAAALDFVMVTDHNMGNNNEYSWWRTQKSNDLYTVPGSFISLYGYERSVQYPQGHRNIIWTERGNRTLPLPGSPLRRESDTARVYEHVKQTNGICTSHTSATNQGTDWSRHDDSLEPVVEIYQGDDASYESPDGPRAVADNMIQVHGPMQPKGFVSEALAKGYRLGFQASSDHISTHVSYACVIADEFSRQGLVAALKARHCYAATDNIVLDFRADGRAMMGDEIHSASPGFELMVQGTGPIDHIDILRNGEVVKRFPVGLDASDARFVWQDQKPPVRENGNYYYARVVQKDGQLAWGSPIWVK